MIIVNALQIIFMLLNIEVSASSSILASKPRLVNLFNTSVTFSFLSTTAMIPYITPSFDDS